MKELLHKSMTGSPEKYLPHLITEEERTHFEKNGLSIRAKRAFS